MNYTFMKHTETHNCTTYTYIGQQQQKNSNLTFPFIWK